MASGNPVSGFSIRHLWPREEDGLAAEDLSVEAAAERPHLTAQGKPSEARQSSAAERPHLKAQGKPSEGWRGPGIGIPHELKSPSGAT
ncbi:MAG: hypothetical protein AB3N33_08505 [Puniceicoccaceae bacterium]